jgi:hypothetical protein
MLALPQQESDCACLKNHPPSGIIVVFSTVQLLYQFPLAEKTRNPYRALKRSDSELRQPEDSHVG